MTLYTTRITLIVVTCVLLTWTAAVPHSLTVTAPQAPVRTGPGVTHSILTVIPQGGIVAILEMQQEWRGILLDEGREGWMISTIGSGEPGGTGAAGDDGLHRLRPTLSGAGRQGGTPSDRPALCLPSTSKFSMLDGMKVTSNLLLPGAHIPASPFCLVFNPGR